VATGNRGPAEAERERLREHEERVLAESTPVEAELDKRWPETHSSPSLSRIKALTDLLGDPQRAYPVVHIAGTNGKTSTARMIDGCSPRPACAPAATPARTCHRATEPDHPGRRPDLGGALRRGVPGDPAVHRAV